MGDLDTSSSVHPAVRSKSCETLPDEIDKSFAKYPDLLSCEQIDEALMRVEQEQGVNVALQRAKVWAKYTKDIVTYVEKRCALELEHCRSMGKLAQATRGILKEEQDAINNLRKARAVYIQRQLEYEKAKDLVQRAELSEGLDASKIDKKKKARKKSCKRLQKLTPLTKRVSLKRMRNIKTCKELKADILKQTRELILQCDQTMKAATVSYFQLLHTVAAPSPVQYQTLCENSRLYEAGSKYMEFVKRLEIPSDGPVFEPPPFSFEPYVPTDSRLNDRRSTNGLEGSEESLTLSSGASQTSEQGKGRKAWCPVSDSDSVGSNQSNKSVDTSPYGSPRIAMRHLDSINDELVEADDVDSADVQSRGFSKAAITHTFRKLRSPARCRECDTYVYFQGLDCIECGLACHKKCVETLALQCGHKRMKPKLTTFGIDLSVHLNETNCEVPHLVTRCIDEIERRGSHIKGIYRVSGVKSKVEKLCQSFENGVELVDLSDIHPNVTANVLKLYLRQLPEPLLTYNLYLNFIQLAQKYLNRDAELAENKQVMKELDAILNKLPTCHYKCLAAIIRHLKRISLLSETNNMPARNLSIVFGPTLLRTSEGSASLSSLVDTVYQTRVVELLIVFSDELFGVDLDKKMEDEPSDENKEDMNDMEIGLSPNIPRKSLLKDDDRSSVHSFDVTDGEGEVPLPPPRRNASHTRLNRISPDCNGDRVLNLEQSGDKIIIHVEGDRILPVAAPRTLVASDFPTKDETEDVPFVDESPPEMSLVQMSINAPGTNLVEMSVNDRPVPSPRYSRLLPCAVHIPVTVTPSSGDNIGDEASSVPASALQPSPVSSVPSTTSSMDELDVLGITSHSPTLSEYMSPYLSQEPYKHIRLGPALAYSRSTSFANYDDPTKKRHSRCISADVDQSLGSRNSLLRTATRHQRHSPAYSTASTKSSESCSSPLPDHDVSSLKTRVSHSLSPPLHRVSSDSNVFAKSTLDDGKLNQRPPRFV
uniref:Rho-GAP domain-containing protein n=1 Tax=Strigamia maritima TaxID=126957 RepID=T1J438_STRMM